MHLAELVQHESTHEVLQVLCDLHDRGVLFPFPCPATCLRENLFAGVHFDVCVYDNACHLDQAAARNTTQLPAVSIAIDRFHQSNHKCSGYEASRLHQLINVNSESCEQLFRCDSGGVCMYMGMDGCFLFRWLSRFRFSANHMNEESFLFFLINVCEGHNRWVLSGRDVQAITASAPCAGTYEHVPENPMMWVVTVLESPPAATLAMFLANSPHHLHRELQQYLPPGCCDACAAWH